MESEVYLITLPLIPSHQGRGNELFVETPKKNTCCVNIFSPKAIGFQAFFRKAWKKIQLIL
jgi:hypothetical protein